MNFLDRIMGLKSEQQEMIDALIGIIEENDDLKKEIEELNEKIVKMEKDMQITLEEFIVIKRKDHYPTAFYIINYCSGERLALGNYSDIDDNLFESEQEINKMQYISEPECDICADFFYTHILIDTIAYVCTDKFLN